MPNQKTVLLVEDDAVLKEMYLARFASEGFKTIEVGSGEEAKEKIEADKIDLVLLDIMLPGKDGMKILKELKETPAFKKGIVVALSNLNNDTIIKEAFKQGIDGYLIKSEINPDRLIEEIRGFLG